MMFILVLEFICYVCVANLKIMSEIKAINHSIVIILKSCSIWIL